MDVCYKILGTAIEKRLENAEKKENKGEGADIFLDYLSDQSKSMSVLYRTQIS